MRHPTKNTRTNTLASAIGVALALLLAMAGAAADMGSFMNDHAGGVQVQAGVSGHADESGPDGGTGEAIGAMAGAGLGDTLHTQEMDRNRTLERNETHLQNGTGNGSQVRAEFRVGSDEGAGAQGNETLRERVRAELEVEHRASFMAARDRYENATAQYRAARQELAQTRANEHTQLGFEVRKRVALSAADTLSSYLTMLRTHVNASTELNAQERAQIETQLRAYGDWLDNETAQINASNDSNELAGVIGQMRERWAHVTSYSQLAAGKSVLAQAQAVQAQAEQASQKVHADISTIAAAGGNVTAAQTLATEFDAHLNASATHLENAQNAYAQANSTTSTSYQTAVSELDAAKADLRAAYDTLRRIVAELHVAASTETNATGGSVA